MVPPDDSNDAKAGAAKSSTLRMLMLLCKNTRFLMTAYNKSIVDQAKKDAPLNVVCSTTHVLAGSKREELLDRGWELRSRLKVNDLWIRLLPQLPYYQQREHGPALRVAVVIREMLELFCISADDVISSKHLPKDLPTLQDPPDYVQVAQELWQCYQTDSFLVKRSERFTFNMYLKMFTMDVVNGRGELGNGPYDVILVDEAQDINPVTLQLLMSQLPHSVLVLVGDKHQHIYTFNNCCNALEQAEALQAYSPGTVRHFSLSSSFRLGPAVAEVVNRVLWQLGERRHFVVPAGFKHAAVYSAVAPPAAVNVPAAAAAVEVSRVTDIFDVPVRRYRNVALALPPVDSGFGRRLNLTTLTRYNKTWVDLAFALPASVPAIEAAGGPVKLFLLAQNSWDSAVQYLDTVRNVYKLLFNGVPFSEYHSAEDLQSAVAGQDPELTGALRMVEYYGHRIPELIQATLAAKVATKQAAHYLLGTCHKAKGTEEDYVQLADDFEPVSLGRKSDVVIDEYNLVYVAASRAKVALVLNRDLEELLHPERHGQLLLQAQVMGGSQMQQEDDSQPAQHVLDPMRLHVGGTVLAAALAVLHGYAINLGGGMHHAHSTDGAGWCPYADISLAIKKIRAASQGAVQRILVVDLDVHQGNGVERDKLAAGDQDLFILDVYNRDAFPWDQQAKAAINVKVELEQGTSDVTYLSALEAALQCAVAKFPQPHLLIYNAGTDILAGDPLGRFNVSPAAVVQRDAAVFALAAEQLKCPIVMLLSGGYTKASAGVIVDSVVNLMKPPRTAGGNITPG
eukprot:gene6602-6830_t